MENNLQKSPKLRKPADLSDVKYISGLSTVLVATIQEAKDRISQIEYIFCSQLFPNFHLISQNTQNIYSEAKVAAEDAFKEKEKEFLFQIEKLQCEKQQFLEENQLLNLENVKLLNQDHPSPSYYSELQKKLKEKTIEVSEGKELQKNLQKLLDSKQSLICCHENTIKELEEKNIMFLRKQNSSEFESEKLQLELLKKSKDIDEAMELPIINQSKDAMLLQKDTQLKECKGKASDFISEINGNDGKLDELVSRLQEKTHEVERGKELQKKLMNKIEYQASEIINIEQLQSKYEMENRHLSSQLESLQKELHKKNKELEARSEVQAQSLLQADSYNFARSKKGHELEEFGRKQLVDEQKVPEEKVNNFGQNFNPTQRQSIVGTELHGKLLQQIAAKDSELLSEKRKQRELIVLYKKLKSQYNFVLQKLNLSPETMLHCNKIEDDNGNLNQDQVRVNSDYKGTKSFKDIDVPSEITRADEEREMLAGNEGVISIQREDTESPSVSDVSFSPNWLNNIKSYPQSGAKRPISYWRDTRSHQSRVGPDPHDDFLDTPLENVREKTGKITKEEMHDIFKHNVKNLKFQASDSDETQDMNIDPKPQMLKMPPSKAGAPVHKYVEAVRKKSDRESLKGMECRQCKKFYDAVLPVGEDADGKIQNLRCEHHNGVSKHRYRYAPPLTPEGFWNIGFESEM